jgi:hypothetical protein
MEEVRRGKGREKNGRDVKRRRREVNRRVERDKGGGGRREEIREERKGNEGTGVVRGDM